MDRHPSRAWYPLLPLAVTAVLAAGCTSRSPQDPPSPTAPASVVLSAVPGTQKPRPPLPARFLEMPVVGEPCALIVHAQMSAASPREDGNACVYTMPSGVRVRVILDTARGAEQVPVTEASSLVRTVAVNNYLPPPRYPPLEFPPDQVGIAPIHGWEFSNPGAARGQGWCLVLLDAAPGDALGVEVREPLVPMVPLTSAQLCSQSSTVAALAVSGLEAELKARGIHY